MAEYLKNQKVSGSCVQLLPTVCGAQAEMNTATAYGDTPLHKVRPGGAYCGRRSRIDCRRSAHVQAVQNGHVDCVRYILCENDKADINAKNKDGNTPLHLAVYYGWLSIVETLVRFQADKDLQNDSVLRQRPTNLRPSIFALKKFKRQKAVWAQARAQAEADGQEYEPSQEEKLVLEAEAQTGSRLPPSEEAALAHLQEMSTFIINSRAAEEPKSMPTLPNLDEVNASTAATVVRG